PAVPAAPQAASARPGVTTMASARAASAGRRQDLGRRVGTSEVVLAQLTRDRGVTAGWTMTCLGGMATLLVSASPGRSGAISRVSPSRYLGRPGEGVKFHECARVFLGTWMAESTAIGR